MSQELASDEFLTLFDPNIFYLNQPRSNCSCRLPHIATHDTLIRAYPGVIPAIKHSRSVGLMQVAVPRPTTFDCLLVYVTSPELILLIWL
jgi:hypothetical protein